MVPCGLGKCQAEPDEQFREPSGTSMKAAPKASLMKEDKRMYPYKRVRVKSYEIALVFYREELERTLGPGDYFVTDWKNERDILIFSKRDTWFIRDDLDVLEKAGKLTELVEFMELRDNQRALVWVDGRFDGILSPGRYAYWKDYSDVRVEFYDTQETCLQTKGIENVLGWIGASAELYRATIKDGCVGLLWLDGQFEKFLGPGTYGFWKEPRDVRVEVVDTAEAQCEHSKLEVLLKSPDASSWLHEFSVEDDEVALVWLDGRFERFLPHGRYAYWSYAQEVSVQKVKPDASQVRFDGLDAMLKSVFASTYIKETVVSESETGLVFVDGRLTEVLSAGKYVYWVRGQDVTVKVLDTRVALLDVSGQEIMTADKVTLRINAVVSYRVSDPVKAASSVTDYVQSLYRDAQLALREVIGTRELDRLLTEKDEASRELRETVQARAIEFGVEVTSLGIKDVILPGDIRELLNKVTEARKAAEAAVITRREETAAMRSQLNSAKLVEGNPALMRLKELELVEKVAEKSDLTLFLGERGLSEQLTKLI